uniref:COX assembly mitochondrial protein n=1 Tax=Saccoglossus kowalevskii TaxID=10224 RepID=A0ABM0GSA1_SACKO|nr:PREDICTED: COX assembly mitochondrial protein homolog [Saccoglossus kowalevskii]
MSQESKPAADEKLRHVELDVLIPKMVRDRARKEKCSSEVQAFSDCAAKSSLGMVLKCRKENSAMRKCLTDWFRDPEFFNSCKQEYLKEREEFRRTGKTKKQKLHEELQSQS